MRYVLGVLVLGALLSPATTTAQSAAPGDLQLEMQRKRHVVLPRPSPEAVEADTEDARSAVTTQERQGQLIEQSRRRPLARPELDHSVTNGIQAGRIGRALR
jgi:hypothetical protein